jgi:hypothetical protein
VFLVYSGVDSSTGVVPLLPKKKKSHGY